MMKCSVWWQFCIKKNSACTLNRWVWWCSKAHTHKCTWLILAGSSDHLYREGLTPWYIFNQGHRLSGLTLLEWTQSWAKEGSRAGISPRRNQSLFQAPPSEPSVGLNRWTWTPFLVQSHFGCGSRSETHELKSLTWLEKFQWYGQWVRIWGISGGEALNPSKCYRVSIHLPSLTHIISTMRAQLHSGH